MSTQGSGSEVCLPEDAEGIPAVAASLFPEAGRVAHVLQREVPLAKPLLPVHGAQRLLRGGDQVLVIALACSILACSDQAPSTEEADMMVYSQLLSAEQADADCHVP